MAWGRRVTRYRAACRAASDGPAPPGRSLSDGRRVASLYTPNQLSWGRRAAGTGGRQETGRRRWAAVVAAAVTGLATCGRPSGPPSADLVVRGARIYTVSPERPWAAALAVAGDRLVFVGDEAGVDAYVGAATRTVDARGRLVLPGFHDSHVHPIIAWEVRSERRSENAGLTLAVNC